MTSPLDKQARKSDQHILTDRRSRQWAAEGHHRSRAGRLHDQAAVRVRLGTPRSRRDDLDVFGRPAGRGGTPPLARGRPLLTCCCGVICGILDELALGKAGVRFGTGGVCWRLLQPVLGADVRPLRERACSVRDDSRVDLDEVVRARAGCSHSTMVPSVVLPQSPREWGSSWGNGRNADTPHGPSAGPS
jgi:hypothetical protein